MQRCRNEYSAQADGESFRSYYSASGADAGSGITALTRGRSNANSSRLESSSISYEFLSTWRMVDKVTFGHYRVLQRDDGSLWELGSSAVGVTYKALDTDLQRPVALKVINSDSWLTKSTEIGSCGKLARRRVCDTVTLLRFITSGSPPPPTWSSSSMQWSHRRSDDRVVCGALWSNAPSLRFAHSMAGF